MFQPVVALFWEDAREKEQVLEAEAVAVANEG